MESELLGNELAGIIARLNHRLRTDPKYARTMTRDTQDNSLELALEGIEDAICGLVMLHIQLRREHQ